MLLYLGVLNIEYRTLNDDLRFFYGGGILKREGTAIGMVVEPTSGGCPWRRTDYSQGWILCEG